MKKESILYGVIGLLVGIVLAGSFGTYAVNNNQRGMMNVMGMNSSRVMNGDMDRMFIEQMIPHHDSAIAMAKLAQNKAKRQEIKTMANNVITSQSAENQQMREWYKNWYGTDVPATGSNQTPGGSMMMANPTNLNSLEAASDFDKAFLEQMISHHQMAVMMAGMLKNTTNRPEMRKLADDIITAQTKEINDMKSWQQQWGMQPASAGTGDMMQMMGH